MAVARVKMFEENNQGEKDTTPDQGCLIVGLGVSYIDFISLYHNTTGRLGLHSLSTIEPT